MKKHIHTTAAFLVPAALFLSLAVPAFAENTPGTKVPGASKEAAKSALINRTITEATKREGDLSSLLSRINGMTHVSDATKSSITTAVQAVIAELGTLKTKITSDTDTATLKSDTDAVIKGTRVYMLVVPQARILAAADRVGVVADMITALNTKLVARITAAEALGKDMSAQKTTDADLVAKLADAKTQALAAINAVSGLTPDNGDKTKMQANEAALKTGRTAIAAAERDIRAAEKDAKMIIAALKTVSPKAEEDKKSSDKNTENTPEPAQQ